MTNEQHDAHPQQNPPQDATRERGVDTRGRPLVTMPAHLVRGYAAPRPTGATVDDVEGQD